VPLATNAFLEDYNADFLVMLESWQTAEKFLTGGARQNWMVLKLPVFSDGTVGGERAGTQQRSSLSACDAGKRNPKALGTNPQALGTNPKARRRRHAD
jgi:hypothetical protein